GRRCVHQEALDRRTTTTCRVTGACVGAGAVTAVEGCVVTAGTVRVTPNCVTAGVVVVTPVTGIAARSEDPSPAAWSAPTTPSQAAANMAAEPAKTERFTNVRR
ncbi:MAG: hypothetical protein KC458_10515, partial [Dehalococcoidia bacterium]|nr:hypothetical protein [Dehalococcoidia bacterium]